MSNEVFYQRTSFIYVVAILISAALSLWIDARVFVINPDAICYLFSSEEVGKSGLHAAMHLCPQAMWPFYSVMIFAFTQLTHLSYTNAAFLFDGVFSALSVVTFIAIVRELGGSSRVLWLASAVMLLSHEFNILRQDIIRDHGFWAFYLASIYFLLHFFRQPNWKSACAWGVSLLVATLFRIEGAIFLLVLPFLSWFCVKYSSRERAKFFLMLNVPLLIILACFAGWLIAHPQQTVNQLGRVSEVGNQLQHGFAMMFETYQSTKAAVAENVLSHNSMRDAGIVVILLLISWYAVSLVGNVSLIYALLVVYAWFTKAANLSRSALLVVVGYLIVNLAVTFGFFAENQFLAKRYLIAFSLVLMLWVPFALEKLWQSKQLKQRVLLWAAAFFIVMTSLGGFFHFGHSKDYIREAGDWLSENIPANAKLYSNDYQVMYYSNHFGSSIFEKLREYNDVTQIAHGRWKQFDYLALLMGRERNDKTAWVMQEIHGAPLEVFVSDSGDHVYIYKVSHQERKP